MCSYLRSGSFIGVAKKNLRFNIRMSDEQRAELDELGRQHGRRLSNQVEHLITLGKMLVEFCDGNDNLEVARQRLAAAKKISAKRRRR